MTGTKTTIYLPEELRKTVKKHLIDTGETLSKYVEIALTRQLAFDKTRAGKKRLKEANFTYDRQSEKALKNLREVAEYEGYLAEDSATFVALEARLKPNLDRDLERYKDDIKKLIAAEIVKRYYYQEGAMIENLKDDKTLQKALDVLADRELYRKTLSRPEEKK